MSITQLMVQQAFDYDPNTGALFRRFKNGRRKLVNFTNEDGSAKVRLLGKDYRAHRLIWLYVYGQMPALFIDHINGDPSDNRICNLREATDAENKRNVGKSCHNTSGLKGVTWDKANNKWIAHATHNGKGKNLGRFISKDDAAAAYQRFAKQNHGAFYREENS